MNDASVRPERFDGLPAWRIFSDDGSTALVAERGATLLSWQPAEHLELIDSYADAAGVIDGKERKNLIEAPWVGPMSDGYTFNGRRYDVAEDAAGGLAGSVDFSGSAAGNALFLKGRVGGVDSYPWKLALSVVYSLEEGVTDAGRAAHLSVSVTVTNESSTPAPVAIGWRPSICVPGIEDVANIGLRIPARTRLASDPRGVPIPGDLALTGITSPLVYGYLGRKDVTATFTSLVPRADGVVSTTATNAESGDRVELTQEPSEAPYVRVEAAGSTAGQRSLVIAPASASANAFIRPEQTPRLSLGAGKVRTLTATLTVPLREDR